MIQRHYDFLKALAQVWIPAIGTLYFALAQIWGIPFGAEVVGTLTCVDAFLGGILRVSTNRYVPPTDGNLLVDTTGEKDRYRLHIDTPLDEIAGKDQIRLGVRPGEF